MGPKNEEEQKLFSTLSSILGESYFWLCLLEIQLDTNRDTYSDSYIYTNNHSKTDYDITGPFYLRRENEKKMFPLIKPLFLWWSEN